MDNNQDNQHMNREQSVPDENDPALDNNTPINNNIFQEETSAEIMDENVNMDMKDDDTDDHFATGNMMGWIGIVLSVLSFFMIPILFAGAGIILGIIARMREANTLGYTAIAVGIVSLVVRLFFVPF